MTPWARTLILLAVAAFAAGPAAFASTPPTDHIDSIPVDVGVPFAPIPVTIEGKRHLIYELHVTDMGRDDLALRTVEVLDGPSRRVLGTYSGAALAAAIVHPGAPDPADPAVIGHGSQAVVFLDIIGDSATKAPVTLLHHLQFAPMNIAAAEGAQSHVTTAPTRVSSTPPAVLAPPLRGGNWLASHGPSNTSSHRRTLLTLNGSTTIAQRFAIDWTQIGPDGQIFRNDPASNANWTPYGADVLAVAGGRVVSAVDGLAENDPTADAKAINITYDNATGNHIVLDIGHGRYVLYAHLKTGSLKVQAGDVVKAGQVLAALGNSGKADAPHLHFQVMNGPSPLASEGLPFVFSRFSLQGHVASLAIFVDGTGWRATEDASMRRLEIPAENAVVAFPQ